MNTTEANSHREIRNPYKTEPHGADERRVNKPCRFQTSSDVWLKKTRCFSPGSGLLRSKGKKTVYQKLDTPLLSYRQSSQHLQEHQPQMFKCVWQLINKSVKIRCLIIKICRFIFKTRDHPYRGTKASLFHVWIWSCRFFYDSHSRKKMQAKELRLASELCSSVLVSHKDGWDVISHLASAWVCCQDSEWAKLEIEGLFQEEVKLPKIGAVCGTRSLSSWRSLL